MLENEIIQRIGALSSDLVGRWPSDLRQAIATKSILCDPAFSEWSEDRHACFYAPFDWINERADIVLIGITPGMQQAEAALLALQGQLKKGSSIGAAASSAKFEASFKGEMRDISARLMDHFGFQRLFGLATTAELFSAAADRVHYTSVLRYPVLERKNPGAPWKNYSGDAKITSRPTMKAMIDRYLVSELRALPEAWLVPFGPVPTLVLENLVQRGVIDGRRVLAGLNHPSGTHWNRHNCQLDLVDHKNCALNVGCDTIQERSRQLRKKVASLI
ncbi:hypothetical protein [Shinella pollutisoli]|uniref:Uracil DNA glycosylase superfamily protein n=1 Tax=Shinella pollutisoli TaxID=2250594 RepID=A0ABV7DP65_9HYPH|nr:hypothetical protein [Shinella pollutisoli]